MTEDVYFYKTIPFKFYNKTLQFRVSQALFSSYEVDTGTNRLLRTLVNANPGSFHKVLDLGCGYGPIGLTLKKLDEGRIVHLVDRDVLAVEYARQNALLNQLSSGVETYGSLGYDDVSTKAFDLITANIPGKAGESVITSLLQDAAYYLQPNGVVAAVVVTPLESFVAQLLNHPSIRILFQKGWPGHTVFHYQFSEPVTKVSPPGQSAFMRGVYDRTEMEVVFGRSKFSVRTAHGLPEFDKLSYESDLLLKALVRLKNPTAVKRVLVFNPGQGQTAVAVEKQCQPQEMTLVDRDLLSLRYAKNNLVLNGRSEQPVTLSHQTGIFIKDAEPFDLILGVLREGGGTAVGVSMIKQAAAQLAPEGAILMVTSSSAATHLETWLRSKKILTIAERKRHKGKSLLVLIP